MFNTNNRNIKQYFSITAKRFTIFLKKVNVCLTFGQMLSE